MGFKENMGCKKYNGGQGKKWGVRKVMDYKGKKWVYEIYPFLKCPLGKNYKYQCGAINHQHLPLFYINKLIV